MGTIARNIVANIGVIPSCGLKLRRNNGGNRILATAHILSNLCLKEEEVRLGGGKLESHEQDIRGKLPTKN